MAPAGENNGTNHIRDDGYPAERTETLQTVAAGMLRCAHTGVLAATAASIIQLESQKLVDF